MTSPLKFRVINGMVASMGGRRSEGSFPCALPVTEKLQISKVGN